MTETDLEEAFLDARRGDEWAITRLFRAIQPQLLRYLSHHAPDVADDLASEVWLSAAHLLKDFEGSARDFRAVLFTIARRRVADHYRKASRRPRLVALGEEEQPGGDDPAEIAVEALSSRQAIDALIKVLPPDQAEVVLLRIVAELSVEEVAQVMGRKPGAVRSLQHRALRRLAKHFDGKP